MPNVVTQVVSNSSTGMLALTGLVQRNAWLLVVLVVLASLERIVCKWLDWWGAVQVSKAQGDAGAVAHGPNGHTAPPP